jgi:DNA-binding MarR family transcriptional regulator
MSKDLPSAEELTGCICLQLRKLARTVTNLYDGALAAAGLTCTQFSILSYLQMRPGISIRELAHLLVMDPTTLTRVLAPLEREGLVEVTPGKDDRRRRAISPTKAGRTAFTDGLPLWRAAQAGLGDRLGAGPAKALRGALRASLQTLAPK